MIPDSPQHTVELMDQAFSQGDIDTLLGFYEAGAVVVTEPAKLARGIDELRAFFEQVVGSGSCAKQLKTRVIEADGLALFISRWTLEAGDAPDTLQTFVATTVFRKQPDGKWKALIDNAIGPAILGPE